MFLHPPYNKNNFLSPNSDFFFSESQEKCVNCEIYPVAETAVVLSDEKSGAFHRTGSFGQFVSMNRFISSFTP